MIILPSSEGQGWVFNVDWILFYKQAAPPVLKGNSYSFLAPSPGPNLSLVTRHSLLGVA